MHHALYALAAHADVEKFDLEDEIVRQAGAALLANASTIDRIIIDVRTERRVEAAFPAPSWDVTVQISATNPVDAEPEVFASLVAEVALVEWAWSVASHEVSEVPDSWIGTATPGPKLNLFLARAPGVDHASYNGWLREAMNDCVERSNTMGARYASQLAQLRGDTALDAVASFWFSTEADLDDALASKALDPILEATVIDLDRSRTQTLIEHRLIPNPNQWPVDTRP